jgi:hypothetical protein
LKIKVRAVIHTSRNLLDPRAAALGPAHRARPRNACRVCTQPRPGYLLHRRRPRQARAPVVVAEAYHVPHAWALAQIQRLAVQAPGVSQDYRACLRAKSRQHNTFSDPLAAVRHGIVLCAGRGLEWAVGRADAVARKVSRRPRRRKLAHAFQWEYIYQRLKLA